MLPAVGLCPHNIQAQRHPVQQKIPGASSPAKSHTAHACYQGAPAGKLVAGLQYAATTFNPCILPLMLLCLGTCPPSSRRSGGRQMQETSANGSKTLTARGQTITLSSEAVMVQDVLVSKNGRQCVDFGRFHDTLPTNDCPTPVKTSGSLSAYCEIHALIGTRSDLERMCKLRTTCCFAAPPASHAQS